MIPKIIHYCWFGGKPLPAQAEKCLKSWKKYCPDYEIRRWDESNFDISTNLYAKQAYEAKKYAFVSDYARFFILEKYGGVYLDTDVELLKPLDAILEKGAFMGAESDESITVAPGLGMGFIPEMAILKEILNVYKQLEFVDSTGNINQKTVVEYTTEVLKKHGLKDRMGIQQVCGVNIYPTEYFAPKNCVTGKISITCNTVSIHHYDASWYTPYQKAANKISHILGPDITKKIIICKHQIKRVLKRD